MKVCIVCQKEISKDDTASMVKEDPAIALIRRVKSLFGIAKNNELYVCGNDLDAHMQKRLNFERNMMITSILAAGLILVLIGLPLLSGRLNLGSLIGSLFIGVMIILVVVFFRYTPQVAAAKADTPKSRGG